MPRSALTASVRSAEPRVMAPSLFAHLAIQLGEQPEKLGTVLQERRAALISAAVTGQSDVCQATARSAA